MDRTDELKKLAEELRLAREKAGSPGRTMYAPELRNRVVEMTRSLLKDNLSYANICDALGTISYQTLRTWVEGTRYPMKRPQKRAVQATPSRTNGHAHPRAKTHVNGKANGHTNGHANGHTSGTAAITAKPGMIEVSNAPEQVLTLADGTRVAVRVLAMPAPNLSGLFSLKA